MDERLEQNGKRRRKLRSADEIRHTRRPHLKDAPRSRRDSGRWVALRHEFLQLCDGGHTVGAVSKHMKCSESTVKRIKAEMIEFGLVEEAIIPGRRGRPRTLALTEQGEWATAYGLLKFKSVLSAYAPTVAEMAAIRRDRRETISGHIRERHREVQEADAGVLLSSSSASYVTRNGESSVSQTRIASRARGDRSPTHVVLEQRSLAASLMANPFLSSTSLQRDAFVRLTGMGRGTFYRRRKDVLAAKKSLPFGVDASVVDEEMEDEGL